MMKKKQAAVKPEAVAPLTRYEVHVIGKVTVSHKFVIEAESEFAAEEIALKRAEEITEAVNWDSSDEVEDFDINESFEATTDDVEDTVYPTFPIRDEYGSRDYKAPHYPDWYKGPKRNEDW